MKNEKLVSQQLTHGKSLWSILFYLMTWGLIYSQTSSQYVVTNLEWVVNYSARTSRENVPSAVDQNGNIYTIGYTTPNGVADAALLKIDSNGVSQWVKTYNGPGNSTDKALGLFLSDSGNIYICGESVGSGTGKDFFTIKYDAAGNQKWVARYNGGGNNTDVAVGLVVDSLGNVYTAGRSTNVAGNFDYCVVKYNASGTQQWVYTYNGTAAGDDRIRSIALSDSNRIYVNGYTTSTGTLKDITAIRINATAGTADWVKTINGSANGNDEGQSLIMDGYDPVIVGGIIHSGSNSNYYIAKLNRTNGNIIWSNTYDGFGNADVAYSIAMNDSGQFGIVGFVANTSYEYHTVIYSNSGSQIAVNQYPINITTPTIAPTISLDTIANYFYVTGETNNGTSNIDVVVYQVSRTGNREWTYTYNGSGNGADGGTGVAVNSYGQLFVCAQTTNSSGYIDMTTFRLSQTPVYFPPDTIDEATNNSYLFYENKGQLLDLSNNVEASVKYYTEHTYPTLYFKPNLLSFKFYTDNDTSILDTIQRIDMQLYESNIHSQLYAFDHEQGYVNYLHSSLPSNVTGVRGFKKLMSPNIYPGIDLHYSSNSEGLKMYFVVRPGYDPNWIKLKFDGADSTYINVADLTLDFFGGSLSLNRPTVYQIDSSGWIVPLGYGAWNNVSTNHFSISPPSYNSSLPLVIVIDRGHNSSIYSASGNLDWSTYYGGSLKELFRAVKTDANGYIYAAGSSTSYGANAFPNFGAGTITTTSNGILGQDAVLVIFDSIGARRAVNIYGSSSEEQVLGVSVLPNGSIVLVGNGGSGLLPPPSVQPTGAYAINTSSGRPGFLVKFGPANTNVFPPTVKDIKWTSRFNGYISDLDNKPNGDIYLTTIFNSANIPDTLSESGAYNNGTVPAGWHNQIWKFDSVGVQKWSTLFPNGSANNSISNLAFWGMNMNLAFADNIRRCKIDCDSTGFVIAGDAQDTTLLTFSRYGATIDSTFNTAIAGNTDAFVARFDSRDSIIFSTYVGGSRSEVIQDVKISPAGKIFIVGSTNSPEDSIMTYWTSGYIDSTLTNQTRTKIYIAEYDTSGNRIWATYYGNNTTYNSAAWALAFDPLNNLYVTGQTQDFAFGVTNPGGTYDQTTFQWWESFMLCFGSVNELKWNTFFGGNSEEIGLDLAFNNNISSLIKVGSTTSLSAPQSNPFPLVQYPGAWFRDKINDPSGSGTSVNISSADCYISRFTVSSFVGVEEFFANHDKDMFVIFPNPSSSEINIVFKEKISEKCALIIRNSIGQKVYERNLPEISEHTIISIPIFALSNGMYVVTLQSEEKIESLKFIKER